jgi:hypothetical protein
VLSTYARAAEVAPLTLVVYAPDEHPEAAATTLRSAIAAAGVQEDACDLVLLAVADSSETVDALSEQVDAVLSDGTSRLEAIGRRQFGHCDARALAVAAAAVAGIVA